MKSNRKGGDIERAIARYMGGTRNSFSDEDISHPIFSIEVKHRQSNPKSIIRYMAQSEACASKRGKIALVIQHEHRQEYGNSFATLRLKDLVDLIGTF